MPEAAAGTQDAFAYHNAVMMQIGNAMLSGAQQNSERLSAMMGIRASQTNPIEASAISSLKNSETGQNTATMTLANALAAMSTNLAHATPNK